MFIKLIYGVGFNSGGTYKTRKDGIKLYSYLVWYNMIRRCYSEEFQKVRGSHKGCSVCDDWHNYQVFAKWYNEQPFTGSGSQLDKDLLIAGNKVYSPEGCSVVPQEINKLISINRSKKSGLPKGVRAVTGNDYYQVNVGVAGKNNYVGCRKTISEAFALYKEAKEKYIKEVANKYKDQIDSRAYEALMKYEVNIDD